MSEISNQPSYPVIACTAEELSRLRTAWRSDGPQRAPVAEAIGRAEAALTKPLAFPPRGSQHNWWYQCEPCQMGLETVDATHHRCPRCGSVYSGEPFDDVLFKARHRDNLASALDAAWAFAITDEPRFGEHAAAVLSGYAERYRAYPYHGATRQTEGWTERAGGHLFEQTLDEANAMASFIAPAFDLVRGFLSDRQQEAIREGLIEPMLANIAKNRKGTSNWQTWHNAALLLGGAVIGDRERVEQALNDPEHGVAFQLDRCISAEGMWTEDSWGYHYYALTGVVAAVEGARRMGIDLWSHPRLINAFVLPIRCTMPDGALPRFGDVSRVTAPQFADLYEHAYHACPSDELAVCLPEKPIWATVLLGRQAAPAGRLTYGSMSLPDTGHVILRTSGQADLVVAATFSPYRGFHAHLDKLSFVLYGHGCELAVDPGCAVSQAYRLPIHNGWYKATIGHNTVVVDGEAQQSTGGRLECFRSSEFCAAAVLACDTAYEGVCHRRTLCLTPDYLLVVDDLRADRPRRFDWLYHHRARCVETDLPLDPTALKDRLAGGEYIHSVRCGRSDGMLVVRFEDDDLTTAVTAAGQVGTELTLGDGPFTSVADRVPLMVLSRCGQHVRFIACIEPLRRSDGPKVTGIQADDSLDGLTVTMGCDVIQIAGGKIVVRHGDQVWLD